MISPVNGKLLTARNYVFLPFCLLDVQYSDLNILLFNKRVKSHGCGFFKDQRNHEDPNSTHSRLLTMKVSFSWTFPLHSYPSLVSEIRSPFIYFVSFPRVISRHNLSCCVNTKERSLDIYSCPSRWIAIHTEVWNASVCKPIEIFQEVRILSPLEQHQAPSCFMGH